MNAAAPPISKNAPPIGMREFVALIASLMALTALGIDSMLPALPAIGESLNVAEPNSRQYVITAFLLGFAFAMLVYGPMADRYGRKPVLAFALSAYVLTNLAAAVAPSFETLLIARAASGAAIAGGRAVTVALVRDCFSGRAMARVMSLAFMVFMAAPVIAPAFGQAVLVFAQWRWIFGGIAVVAGAILLWFVIRMPETLAPGERRAIDAAHLLDATRQVLRDRYAVGYTLAATVLQGALFGFIGSIQQVMQDIFRRPDLLTLVFAGVAGTMAVANLLNSRIVMRLGTRLISHSALVGFIVFAGLHLWFALSETETLASFVIVQALLMASFGLATANFSAMAMERMGAIAGTAASLQGFVSTLGGAVGGALVGQAFDGTTIPLYTGFIGAGLIVLVIVLVAERGRLFRPAQG